MNIAPIKKYLELQDALRASGVVGLGVWDQEIHIKLDEIMKLPNLKRCRRYTNDFPVKIKTEYEGVKLFAIADDHEIRRYKLDQIEMDHGL